MKKTYSKPRLVVHGDIERLTQQGGGGFADMHIGIGDAVNDSNTGS